MISVLEVQSVCTAPKFRDFILWIQADNYGVLNAFDVDHSSDLSRFELRAIVNRYDVRSRALAEMRPVAF